MELIETFKLLKGVTGTKRLALRAHNLKLKKPRVSKGVRAAFFSHGVINKEQAAGGSELNPHRKSV